MIMFIPQQVNIPDTRPRCRCCGQVIRKQSKIYQSPWFILFIFFSLVWLGASLAIWAMDLDNKNISFVSFVGNEFKEILNLIKHLV